jgi:hypothetical protein
MKPHASILNPPECLLSTISGRSHGVSLGVADLVNFGPQFGSKDGIIDAGKNCTRIILKE